jgi:hypothetical protein
MPLGQDPNLTLLFLSLLLLLLLQSEATRETDYASSHCTN